jgi:hypothetical protein
MRYRKWMVAALGAVSTALTGCSGTSDGPNASVTASTEQSAAATPKASETSERPAAAAAEPEPGTCWAVPAASVTDHGYWFDDSAQVSCTDPHTTETVTTYSLAEPTIEEAERLVHYCWADVRDYLGIDEDSWVPWGVAAFLPSKEVAAAGPAWVRCDAFFPTTTQNSGARTTDVPARGIADAPPADFWACTDKPPARADQPLVRCDRPHNYEQTGTLAILDGVIKYPSAAELTVEARRQCREGVPAGYDDVSVSAAWEPRSTFVEGTGLAGWCFMFHPTGRPLPAR